MLLLIIKGGRRRRSWGRTAVCLNRQLANHLRVLPLTHEYMLHSASSSQFLSPASSIIFSNEFCWSLCRSSNQPHHRARSPLPAKSTIDQHFLLFSFPHFPSLPTPPPHSPSLFNAVQLENRWNVHNYVHNIHNLRRISVPTEHSLEIYRISIVT